MTETHFVPDSSDLESSVPNSAEMQLMDLPSLISNLKSTKTLINPETLIDMQLNFIGSEYCDIDEVVQLHDAIKQHVSNYLSNYLQPEEAIPFKPKTNISTDFLNDNLVDGFIDIGLYQDCGGCINCPKPPMGFNLPHWENNNNSNNENVGDDGLAHKDTQQNANPLLTLPIPKAPSDLNENGTEVSDLIQEIDFDRDTLLGFKIATDESYFKKIAEIDGSSKRVFTDEEHHYLIDLISTKRFNFLVELKNKGYYFSSEQREIEFKILQSEHYIQLFPPETDLIQVVLPEGYGSFDYDDYESDDEELPYPYLEL